MKTKKQVTKNLTHGYIFLITLILVPFLICLGLEIHFKGGFNINLGQEEKPGEITAEAAVDDPDPTFKLEIENLQNGYKTKETSITIVGVTEKNAIIFIQSEKVEINEEARFERKLDLNPGKNEITIQAFVDKEKKREIKLEVIREEEPE